MCRHLLTVPELDLPGTTIRLTAWLASVGDRVVEGDRLAEIWAGPVTIDLDSPATGVLTEKLVAVDEAIEVGQSLGVILSRK